MGHEVSQQGPGWLPGELEALAAMGPLVEDEVSEDDFLTRSDWADCDWDDVDWGGSFGWHTEAEAVDAECGAPSAVSDQAVSAQSVPARVSAVVARLRAAVDELVVLAGDPGWGWWVRMS